MASVLVPRVLEEDRRDWPHAIRALLLAWGVSEERDGGRGSELIAAAGQIADRILSETASLDCAWALFPLYPDSATVTVSFAAEAMEAMVQLACAGGGGHYIGKAQHVAHVLQSQQGADGSWPGRCDARRGNAVGEGRCAAAPMMLMNRLDQVLDANEFGLVVERARTWILAQTQHTPGERTAALPERIAS